MKNAPQITKTTFWDVNILDVDFDNYYEWVIARVFNYGTLDEVDQLLKYCGNQKVLDTVTTTDRLRYLGVKKAMKIFNLNIDDIVAKRTNF